MIKAVPCSETAQVPDMSRDKRAGAKPAVRTPTLHVVYRSCAAENRKGRPSFYSKRLALLSLLRAATSVRSVVDLLFVNDGTIPSERLALMRSCGDVMTGTSMGVRGSYRQALAAARSRGWSGHDLVWFSEDDYLYRASALADLTEASLIWPRADYFALYASIGPR